MTSSMTTVVNPFGGKKSMLYYGKSKKNPGKATTFPFGRKRNPMKDVGKIVGIALLGGAIADGVDFLLGKVAPVTASGGGLKPWQRGSIQVGVGLLGGGLLAAKYPQIAAAVAAGNVAIGGQALVYEARTYLAARAAAQQTPQNPPTQLPGNTTTPPTQGAGHGFGARRYPAYMGR